MERVYKWLTSEGDNPRAEVYTDWFASTFEPANFDGIDRIMASFIKYCSKLSIAPKQEFLDAYLKVDGKRDVKRYNIKTDTMASYDYKESSQLEEAYQIIAEMAKATYQAYISVDITDRDFKVDMYEFMNSLKSGLIQSYMMEAYPKLMDGTPLEEVLDKMGTKISM